MEARYLRVGVRMPCGMARQGLCLQEWKQAEAWGSGSLAEGWPGKVYLVRGAGESTPVQGVWGTADDHSEL